MARASGELPEGWEFRLPTEAQWEYACRAGTTTATSFGDIAQQHAGELPGQALQRRRAGSVAEAGRQGRQLPAERRGASTTCTATTFEWCRDWYHAKLPGGVDPDLHGAESTATRSEHGDISRVRRGGCWADDGWPCRSAFRLRFEPERRHDHIGFRVVLVQT